MMSQSYTLSNSFRSELRRSPKYESNVGDDVIRRVGAFGAKRDSRLIHLLCKKVGQYTLQTWAEHCDKVSFPSLNSFIIFIKQRSNALGRM